MPIWISLELLSMQSVTVRDMRITITTLIIILSITASIAQNLDYPIDFRSDKILIYQLTSDELIESMTHEYERVHTKEECSERAAKIRETDVPNDRIQIGDTYGIMFDLTNMDWLNETIEKATEKRRDKDLILVNQFNLKAYEVRDYRYVLKYKFIMDNQFPPYLRLVFYFHDRIEEKELLDHGSPNETMTFIPIIGYAGKGELFYGTIRRFKAAKEIRTFLEDTL
jgi:hypothetical protein